MLADLISFWSKHRLARVGFSLLFGILLATVIADRTDAAQSPELCFQTETGLNVPCPRRLTQAELDAALAAERRFQQGVDDYIRQYGPHRRLEAERFVRMQLAAEAAQVRTRPALPSAVRPAPTAPPTSPAVPPASSGSGLQPRTVQAYFAWGMALGPKNTRNPRCFSNIFSVTYQSAPNGNGDAGRAEAEAGRLASVFRQKCERLGRMDPGTPLATIGLPGVPFSAPYITAEDYRVTLP